ncbi:MAG TPA: DUF1080 domain-containing protein [Fimbriiglobus sp.]|jgi:hypothetical protein|nr:DUF1080 domain-containing protein [Fimbriiglobus sp.]
MARLLALVAAAVLTAPALAQDGRPLFNGKDFSGWQKADGKPVTSGWIVKDATMVRNAPGGDIWTKDRYGDFVLELEFKTTGNSGVFIRTDSPKNNVQTGIEVQVDVPRGKPNAHSVGSIYDLVTPTRENSKKEDWNKLKITALGSKLTVETNGEQVAEMDLDKWTQGNKNPDGSPNKFKTALKDFKREGHIGLQDHGAAVMYRNIKIKELK